jgi:hypothetical protein
MENREIDKEISAVKRIAPNLEVEFGRSRIAPDLFKFHIYDDQAKGFGASFNLFEAFDKARSEYFERSIFLQEAKTDSSIRSSSGFACHVNREKAELASLCEVVERDAFLISWLTKNPPVWIDIDLAREYAPEIDSSIFKIHGVELKIGFVAKVGDIFVAVSCIVFEKGAQSLVRFAIDTSASRSVANALKSVYKGALIRLESYLFSDREILKQSRLPLFHLYSNSDSLTPSAWFVEGGDNLLEYEIPKHHYRHWEVSINTKMYVACCDADVQSYYCGDSIDAFINFKRIQQIFPEFDLIALNRSVHPLP